MPRPGSGSPAAAAVARAPAVPLGEALVEQAKLGGQVGFLVVDAGTGTVLESFGAETPLPPASTAKAITSLYALERLGPGHRFVTRLIATGPVTGGRLDGDLVLTGTGDPTVTTDTLADMAAALRVRGVRAVSGRFLVDEGALPSLRQIDPGQPDYVGYNPAISGMNLNFNRVNFEWRRGSKGWDVQMDARSDRFVPLVSMARMKVVNRELPVYTFDEAGGVETWTVASRALGKGGSRWLPVRQPGAYAGDVFRTLARAQGIEMPEPTMVRGAPGGTVLAEVPSAALTAVLQDMLKHSTNLTAEVVGLTASGDAHSLEDSARRMSEWAARRYGRAGRFVDHSGLGAGSRVAPADMVTALVAARGGPLRGLLKPFSLRDMQGQEIKGSPVKVAAKTGTLNFVSGLVGYVTPPGGRDMAFAILAADPARRDAVPMADREQPPGGTEWLRRARRMQGQLLGRWAAVYG